MMVTVRSWFTRVRKILLLVGVLMLFVTIFLYFFAFRGFPVAPETLMVNKSDFKDGKLILRGSTSSSAATYSGYTYRIKDGKLVLNIRYVPLPNKWHPSGTFRIEISEKDMLPIREVYINGKGNSDVLVWARKN